MNSNWSYSPETVKLGCDLCDLDLWPFAWTLRWSLVITPENFMMIRWWEHSQKGVTDRRTDRQTKNTICRAAWSQLKTVGHLYYATSSSMHHFVAISEFQLELHSGNAQFGSKSTIFFSRVTLQFDVWPWTRQIWGIWKLRPAYSPETPNLGQNRWCFVPCDLEIWWMTENNRAPLLCCFKLCATFHSHLWIQTGVVVRKRPIWVKLDDF